MENFTIGDYVAVLDEDLCGKVKRVEGNRITLVTPEGFSLHYNAKALVKMEGDIPVSPFEIAQAKKEKDLSRKKSATRISPKQPKVPKLEIDLHGHQLVKSTKGLSPFDILNLQLQTAKRQLDFAIEKHIQKVIFIHGVGEGVLKAELYYLFKTYPNLKFYDADYQKYGLGATEVYIFQNP